MKYTALRKWHLSVIATFRQHFCFCTLQIPLCKFSKHQIPDACWFSYGFELTVRAWSVNVLHITLPVPTNKLISKNFFIRCPQNNNKNTQFKPPFTWAPIKNFPTVIFKIFLPPFIYIGCVQQLYICRHLNCTKMSFPDIDDLHFMKWSSRVFHKTITRDRFWIIQCDMSGFEAGACTAVPSLCSLCFLY